MPEREQFENLREAFCSRYRCSSEAYTRKVFWKSLSLRSRLLAIFLGGSGNSRFAHDLEVIQSLASCTGYDELNHSLDELVGMQHMDRSRLRQWLGMRVDALRLRMLLEPLIGNVRRRSRLEVPSQAGRTDTDLAPGSAPSRSVESGTQRLRQIMRIHAAVVVGVPPEDALAKEMLRFSDLEVFLTEFARLRPEIAWLLGYLREREELKRLRSRMRQQGSFETI